MSLATEWFWPNVDSRKNALFAIEEAFWVALIVSVFTFVFILIELLRAQESGFDFVAFANCIFFVAIAFGIRRKSRIAALAGFMLYVFSRVYVLVATGHENFIIPILVALALLHGVRGTFSYHRLPLLPAGMPSIEESFKAVAAESRHPNEEAPPK